MLSFCWVSLISDEFLLSCVQIQHRFNKISTETTEFNRNRRNSTDSTQIQKSSYMAAVASSAISAGWDLVITTLPPFRDTRSHHYGSRCYITESSYMAVVATRGHHYMIRTLSVCLLGGTCSHHYVASITCRHHYMMGNCYVTLAGVSSSSSLMERVLKLSCSSPPCRCCRS